MKTILFFNNKGGVGKTTLACNLVAYLNINKQKRVLLIDADPQCNSTQAILPEDNCEELYLGTNTRENTLYDFLKPLEVGEADIDLNPQPILGTANRYQTDLIPGHPKISVIEDILSEAWTDIRGRRVGGFRITNWCHHLTQHFRENYDYIVIDVGPSLGALNRSIVLSCDYLVTPFGCDIFSLLGIKNIAGWISSWKSIYESAINEINLEERNNYNLLTDLDSKFRFGGFSVQQYVSRKFKSGIRPVKSYDRIMSEIPGVIHECMNFLYPEERPRESFLLGNIPYIYSLIPLSQSAKAPVFRLGADDGLIGAQYKQKEDFARLLDSISNKLLANLR